MVKNGKKKSRKSGSSSCKKSKRASKIGAVTLKSDGIEMSQQLLRSMRKPRARANRSSEKRNTMELVCGKQHMPPLSELEKMYEESDDEMTEATSADSKTLSQNGSVQVSSSNVIIPPTSISPTTAKKYADEILKILNGNETPPPIIPMKRYKKTEVPYIVNCTERPKVPETKNCNVFKGENYGITSKTNALSIDENYLEKPGFNCSGYNLSKSIFNAEANKIASKLLSTNYKPINCGSDSDDTVVYELNSPKSRFSPQPSTSKDSETILKNDKKFNESIVACNKCYDEVDNRVEQVSKVAIVNKEDLVNIDVEMKDPNDSEKANSSSKIITLLNSDIKLSPKSGFYRDVIDITEQPCETIEIDDDDDNDDTFIIDVKTKASMCSKRENNNSDTAGVNFEFISENKDKINESICIDDSPIIVEDVFDPHIIAEIDLTNINVDDVISENKSIINKYSKHNTLNTVNIVEADVSTIYSTDGTSIHKKISNKQLESKFNQNNVIKTINQRISNELEHIMNQFFNNIENIVLPHNLANKSINSLSSHERILPQCTLSSSVNSLQGQNNLSQNIESPHEPLLGTCPICLDDLSKETMGSTNCGHLFCMPCITKALNTKPKRCPTCRKKLTGAGYHQIFM